jgi:hypothetical protein
MLEQIIGRFPEGWREMAHFLLAPISWVPRAQEELLGFFLASSSGWVRVGLFASLFMPVLLLIVGMWCTQLAVYTLPFRSNRGHFVSLVLLSWWDAARTVWMFWVGMVRFAWVIAGWLIALVHMALRLVVGLVKEVVMAPFSVGGMMTRSYFQPGVPWIAFIMLLFWCALEAAIFTYTLLPTVNEVLADLVGSGEAGRYTAPVLYMFLLMLIMGSFACVQALTDAAKKREMKFLVQIVLVEIFVMMFEVLFLYRELVDAVTPWLVEAMGSRVGPFFTLAIASFGWVGIRGMTWFLFGQYGTPPLLGFISRQPMVAGDDDAPQFARAAPAAAGASPWRMAIDDFKQEIGWLHERSEQVLEYLALPVLHLLAAALNFTMILLLARPAFHLPFRALREVTDARDALTALHLAPRKQATP